MEQKRNNMGRNSCDGDKQKHTKHTCFTSYYTVLLIAQVKLMKETTKTKGHDNKWIAFSHRA